MINNSKRVNPKELKGKDRKNRVMELMEQLDPKQNNELPKSSVELVKRGPDDKIYAIVRENKRYYIKRGDYNTTDEEGTPIISESNLKYIGDLANKTKHSHPSYSKALKQMNMMFTNIFESEGEKNNIINPSVSDNIIITEDDSNAVDAGSDEEGNDKEPTILYDDELSDEEEEIDELIKNGGERPIKKEHKKPEYSLKKAILENDGPDDEASKYNEFIDKMAKKHFDAETDEELGHALKTSSEEERQAFFNDLDKWTSDEEEKYITTEDEDKNNAWAICNAQANKDGGWSDEKIERCVKDVKKQNESRKRNKKKITENEDEGIFFQGEEAEEYEEMYDEELIDYLIDAGALDSSKKYKVKRAHGSIAVDPVKSKNESHKPGKKKVVAEDEDDFEHDKRYVLKNPSADEEGDVGDIETDGLEDLDLGDEEGMGDEEGGEDTPFDDEPFDPGVEADEEEDPEKFIQQLAGKLSTTLRNYNKEQAEPDTDLEQYAVNMILDASHPEEFSDEEQQEIIDRVKGEKEGEPEGMGDEEEGEPEEETGEEFDDEEEDSIEDELDTDLTGDEEEDEEKEVA